MRLQLSVQLSTIFRTGQLLAPSIFAAAVAGDPQEPRREGAERLGQGLGGRGQRVP
jgi:hypothetical protein